MEKRPPLDVCLFLPVSSSAGVLSSDVSTGMNSTGVPLYVYAVALVVVISVAAFVYHSRSRTAETTNNTESEDKPDEGAEDAGGEEDVSDYERVLCMIESEGGRMKQKHIVNETGWSEAKVSKLTSRMEDEGDITKIRLGRENILETTDEKGGGNEEPPV